MSRTAAVAVDAMSRNAMASQVLILKPRQQPGSLQQRDERNNADNNPQHHGYVSRQAHAPDDVERHYGDKQDDQNSDEKVHANLLN